MNATDEASETDVTNTAIQAGGRTVLTARAVPALAALAASADWITASSVLTAVAVERAVRAVAQGVTRQLTARTCPTETTPALTGDRVAP